MPPIPQVEIKAIAFDLDGLMFNTEELYDVVGERFLARRGHRPDQRLTRQMMGRPANIAIPLMIEWFGLSESFEEVMQECDAIFDQILPERLQPMPGLLALLDHVSRLEIPAAITTSSSLRFVNKLLSLSGLPHQFDFFLTAESITEGKPHPEIYLKAASQFRIEPSNMMVFEDSENGCKAAIASGAFAIAVPTIKSKDHAFDGASLHCENLEDRRIFDLLS